MKKIFKVFALLTLVTGLIACGQYIAIGNWENVQKNPDNTTVTTSLTINQNGQEYQAVMETKVQGAESENLQVPVKSVKFSGSVYGKTLYINDVDYGSSDFSYRSTLSISDDGKILTLNPGKIKFQRK
jgi:hypothetical protein